MELLEENKHPSKKPKLSTKPDTETTAEVTTNANGKKIIHQKLWRCDVCKIKCFPDYDEACAHEERCKVAVEKLSVEEVKMGASDNTFVPPQDLVEAKSKAKGQSHPDTCMDVSFYPVAPDEAKPKSENQVLKEKRVFGQNGPIASDERMGFTNDKVEAMKGRDTEDELSCPPSTIVITEADSANNSGSINIRVLVQGPEGSPSLLAGLCTRSSPLDIDEHEYELSQLTKSCHGLELVGNTCNMTICVLERAFCALDQSRHDGFVEADVMNQVRAEFIQLKNDGTLDRFDYIRCVFLDALRVSENEAKAEKLAKMLTKIDDRISLSSVSTFFRETLSCVSQYESMSKGKKAISSGRSHNSASKNLPRSLENSRIQSKIHARASTIENQLNAPDSKYMNILQNAKEGQKRLPTVPGEFVTELNALCAQMNEGKITPAEAASSIMEWVETSGNKVEGERRFHLISTRSSPGNPSLLTSTGDILGQSTKGVALYEVLDIDVGNDLVILGDHSKKRRGNKFHPEQAKVVYATLQKLVKSNGATSIPRINGLQLMSELWLEINRLTGTNVYFYDDHGATEDIMNNPNPSGYNTGMLVLREEVKRRQLVQEVTDEFHASIAGVSRCEKNKSILDRVEDEDAKCELEAELGRISRIQFSEKRKNWINAELRCDFFSIEEEEKEEEANGIAGLVRINLNKVDLAQLELIQLPVVHDEKIVVTDNDVLLGVAPAPKLFRKGYNKYTAAVEKESTRYDATPSSILKQKIRKEIRGKLRFFKKVSKDKYEVETDEKRIDEAISTKFITVRRAKK